MREHISSQREKQPYQGLWGLFGGHRNRDDAPLEVAREVQEEYYREQGRCDLPLGDGPPNEEGSNSYREQGRRDLPLGDGPPNKERSARSGGTALKVTLITLALAVAFGTGIVGGAAYVFNLSTGAPPDDASFTLNITITYNTPGYATATMPEIVHITGHPDLAGGSVCQTEDTGQLYQLRRTTLTSSTLDKGTPYDEASVYHCAGTYKAGQINLTETMDSYSISYPDTGQSCKLNLSQPMIDEQWSGSYVGNNTFKGIVHFPGTPSTLYSCNFGTTEILEVYGTWTGTITGNAG
jgi:hypothetical protein